MKSTVSGLYQKKPKPGFSRANPLRSIESTKNGFSWERPLRSNEIHGFRSVPKQTKTKFLKGKPLERPSNLKNQFLKSVPLENQ